jgi:hypothetical protein
MTATPIAGRRSPATRIGSITVEIIGTDLPGRTCGPDPDGPADGRDVVFRGAKFRLSEMGRALFEQALGERRPLIGTLGLTDEQGWPRCATVRPPVIRWTVA